MHYQKLRRAEFIVGAEGGAVTFHDSEGATAFTLPLKGGRHKGADLVDLLPEGGTVEAGAGVYALQPPSRIKISRHPNELDTGASQDFQPSRMTASELELRKMMRNVSARSDALERRLQTLNDTKAQVQAERQQAASEPPPAPSDVETNATPPVLESGE